MSARRPKLLTAKIILFAFFALLTLFVIYNNEVPLLNKNSPDWQHFAPVAWWLLPHGVGGALALVLAPLQFSNRLRQRNLRLHRILGRVYVASVVIAAPLGIPLGIIQGPPALVMAAVVQSTGWLVATAVALYCVRTGNIQQHREWMIRGYPFAMAFVINRAVMAVPAINNMGETALVSVVWTVIAAACFIPTFIINWRKILPRRRAASATEDRERALEAEQVIVTT